MFTHGGLITAYLYELGVRQMPSNCSFLGVSLEDQDEKLLGEARALEFEWRFPHVEEDI